MCVRRGSSRRRDPWRQLVWKGVHTGPTADANRCHSAIEKANRDAGLQVDQVEGGQIKSASHYFDMLTMLTQIGATGAVKTAA